MSRAGRIPRRGEPWSFPASAHTLLDEVAESIRPDDEDLAGWFDRYRRQHQNRLVADLDLIERAVGTGASILEYGSVPLLMTGALARRGYRVQGLDLAPERFATAIAANGLDVERCDVEREAVPFETGTFDAVLFHELFEHLRIDPIRTLREAHRVLAPGGRLLLSTPNLRSLRGLRGLLLHNRGHTVSGGIYEQYEKVARLGHMGHVREYTSREVTEFLERIGFRIDELVFRGGHGKGAVGLIERLAPSLRPFVSVIATKLDSSP